MNTPPYTGPRSRPLAATINCASTSLRRDSGSSPVTLIAQPSSRSSAVPMTSTFSAGMQCGLAKQHPHRLRPYAGSSTVPAAATPATHELTAHILPYILA